MSPIDTPEIKAAREALAQYDADTAHYGYEGDPPPTDHLRAALAAYDAQRAVAAYSAQRAQRPTYDSVTAHQLLATERGVNERLRAEKRDAFVAGAEAMRTAATLACFRRPGAEWAGAEIVRIDPTTLEGCPDVK